MNQVVKSVSIAPRRVKRTFDAVFGERGMEPFKVDLATRVESESETTQTVLIRNATGRRVQRHDGSVAVKESANKIEEMVARDSYRPERQALSRCDPGRKKPVV